LTFKKLNKELKKLNINCYKDISSANTLINDYRFKLSKEDISKLKIKNYLVCSCGSIAKTQKTKTKVFTSTSKCKICDSLRNKQKYINDLDYRASMIEKATLRNRSIASQLAALSSSERQAIRDLFKLALQLNLQYNLVGSQSLEIDHIQPLNKNGRHCIRNLQIINREHNRAKSNSIDYKGNFKVWTKADLQK